MRVDSRGYIERSDPIGKFIKEYCVEDADKHIFKWEFKEKLEEFCKKNGYRCPNKNEIKSKLEELGFEDRKITSEKYDDKSKKNKRWNAWHGILWNVKVVNPVKGIYVKSLYKELSINSIDTLDTLDTFINKHGKSAKTEEFIDFFGEKTFQNMVTFGHIFEKEPGIFMINLDGGVKSE